MLDNDTLINTEKIDKIIKYFISQKCFPGAVLAIGTREKSLYLKAFGFASLYPTTEKMTEDKIFDLASLTKVVCTTSLIMKGLEEGMFRLDDKISMFLSGFKHDIRIRDLLTHTSGLPAHKPLYNILHSKDEIISYLSNLELEYPPGSKVVYSDLGFILLGFILEKVYDMKLDELAREKIFDPLDMNDTMFNPDSDLKKRCVSTEYCKIRKRYIKGEVHDENAWFMGGVAGHAGLFSTTKDLSKFAQMMLNYGKYNGYRIFSKRTIELFTKNHTSSLGVNRGLGWGLKNDYCSCGDLMSEKAYGHTGFTGTSLWIDPIYDIYIVLLTNRVHPSRENICILRARPIIHNVIMSNYKG